MATEYGTGMHTEIRNNGTGIKILKPRIGSGLSFCKKSSSALSVIFLKKYALLKWAEKQRESATVLCKKNFFI